MNFDEIRAEAGWVLDRLRDGRSVLVHCVAGFNRSVTVAIAVLILQEGLSAEAAFARVSEHHPWARPDPGHWLHL
jgi:protein-tyrosine phosphatase